MRETGDGPGNCYYCHDEVFGETKPGLQFWLLGFNETSFPIRVSQMHHIDRCTSTYTGVNSEQRKS